MALEPILVHNSPLGLHRSGEFFLFFFNPDPTVQSNIFKVKYFEGKQFVEKSRSECELQRIQRSLFK